MSLRVMEEKTDTPPAEISPQQAEFEAVSLGHRLDNWLEDHLNGIAFAVITAGLGFRAFIASQTYLNPDEALHYWLVNQGTIWRAYQASLSNAHPPLFYLIIYIWHLLGRSELMLRMPSVMAGTAFCWLAYRWLKKILGTAASLIGLVFFAFCPACVALSAEVRAYSVMLFCVAGALYFLAAAFEEKRVARMWCFSVFLYLAIFSHYAVLFFTVAAGVYVLARILDSQLPRNVVIAWILGQVIAAAEYVFLYVTHVSKLKNYIPTWSFEYFGSYYRWADGDILTFTWQKTLSIFTFLFEERYQALVALLLFLAGVALIIARDILGRQKDSPMNRLGLFLLLPFALFWGGSLAGIYPYAGTRHTVVLAPFAVAGVSFVMAKLSGQRLWAGLVLAGLLVTFSNLFKDGVELDAFSEGRSPAQMRSAVDYMRKTIPPGDYVVADYQSALPLIYYFCGPNEIVPINAFAAKFFEFACHGESIVSIHEWKLIPAVFQNRFETIARSHGLKPGDRVWVYQTGWGQNLGASLAAHDPQFGCMHLKVFGKNTAVIPFVVGPDFRPALPPGSCSIPAN